MARILRVLGVVAVVLVVWWLTLERAAIGAAFRDGWPSLVGVVVVLAALYFGLRRFGGRLMVGAYGLLNRFVAWHRLPPIIGALNLDAFRIVLREKNLYDVPRAAMPPSPWSPSVASARTADGSYNDLSDPEMGRAGARFGRNVPLSEVVPEAKLDLMTPNPRLVSHQLMARDSFKPATILNLLAAAWIQFMVHGWVNHKRDPEVEHVIPAEDDEWPHGDEIRIERTLPDSKETPTEPVAYANTESHWWDASQLYGSSRQIQDSLRSGEGGMLKVVEHPSLRELRLPEREDELHAGFDLTGFFDNYWMGLSVFHTVFALEHNAICRRLADEYPEWGDEQLFQTARLVNSALMAKIHTVEWTPAILAHPTLRVSMDANWWGLFGERIKRMLGRLSEAEEVSGIIGSTVDHHSADFSLTEEFTCVYRLHSLIPDEFHFHTMADPQAPPTTMRFTDIQGKFTRGSMDDRSIADIIYSFGIAYPGAVTLKNHPATLRDFERLDGRKLDLAAIDILRDRERGVPRYNQFRRLCHMPPIERFEDITADRELAMQIKEVYGGDLEAVDLVVGLHAETPPEGFGFSDTAFRIFILMASRRLKSDRFFCEDYSARVYTQLGLDWVDANDMSSVFLRHYPALAPVLKDVENAFAPWQPVTITRPA